MGGGVACQQPTEPEAPVEPTKYTISFDSGVESITVEEGAVATKPTDPEKTGYSFGGWLNDEAAYDWTQPVTSNLSLTAKWTAVEYTITYLPEGVETDNPTTYTIEKETFALADPKNAPDATKPNFVAWHNGEKPAEGEWAIVDSIEKGTTGNLTIVAEFSDKEQITITFKGDYTGTKNVDKDSTFAGLTGYDLFYEDGKAFDTTKAIDAAITLTAKAKEFKVTFDSGVEAITVKYNETVEVPTPPTKEGFDFVGWYEGDTKFDFATKITKDISLTAKWEEKKATESEVTYDEVTVDGNTTTILRPTMETAWGATVKGNVISFSGNSAAKWTYKDITNYTFVEIFYETTKESNIKLSMKSSDGNENHKDVGYPELKTSGSLKYSIGNFKEVNENFSHIVLANNANDNDWTNGPTWDDDWSITITKIVLTIVESTGEKVLFDPATFEGETIELDGELYAVVTVDGYNTTFKIDPAVDCSAVSSFKAKMCAKEANAQYNFTVKIADESGFDISSMNYYNVESTPKVCSAGYAEKTDWNTVSETNIATTLQPMVQDSANGYAAVSGFVVYIGKVYAE